MIGPIGNGRLGCKLEVEGMSFLEDLIHILRAYMILISSLFHLYLDLV